MRYLIPALAMVYVALPARAELDAHIEDDAVIVTQGEQVVTAYKFSHDQKYPYFYPVNGPVSGESVTTETSEPYPHHHSLFFGCDKVMGGGYPGNYWQDTNEKGQILSETPKIMETGEKVVIEDTCLWKRPEKEPIIRDTRHIAITAPTDKTRILDFTITLKALSKVRIEKTNHSLFSARMTPALSVEQGGTLINAGGGKNAEGTFGIPADWCAYYGTRDGVTEGLAIMQAPDNRWYPAPWFTRDYGFFSPTPMNFLEEGHFDLAPEEELTLKYRVVIFEGTAEDAGIAAIWDAFAAG